MSTTKTTTVNGYEIKRSTIEGRPRWYVQRYHEPSGLPFAEELCPHFYTQKQAVEACESQV